MPRRGSLSLQYVVIGFIVLSTALVLVGTGIGAIGSSFTIFGEQFEDVQEESGGEGSGVFSGADPDSGSSSGGTDSGSESGGDPGDGTTVSFGPSGVPCEYIDDPTCPDS